MSNPLAIAWDEWLASDEGKSAAQWESLPRNGTASRFLENRLHRAFDAGASHFDEVVAALETLLSGLPVFPNTDDPNSRIKNDHLGLLTVRQINDARKVLAAVKTDSGDSRSEAKEHS